MSNEKNTYPLIYEIVHHAATPSSSCLTTETSQQSTDDFLTRILKKIAKNIIYGFHINIFKTILVIYVLMAQFCSSSVDLI